MAVLIWFQKPPSRRLMDMVLLGRWRSNEKAEVIERLSSQVAITPTFP